jgi:CheY-like chemotaxis protein
MSKAIEKAIEVEAYPNTILVVDDSSLMRTFLTLLLKKQGHIVLNAEDGYRVLKMAEIVIPDLIIMDVDMPGMDGFQLCERLKNNANTTNIPVIFLTARSDVRSRNKALFLGASAYLVKPIGKKKLFETIQSNLNDSIAIKEHNSPRTLTLPLNGYD